MATEEAVKTLPMDHMPMADYKAARAKGETEVEQEEEKPEVQQEEKPKSKGGFQKRIDRLHKMVAETEKRAEAAERRAQELEARNGHQEQPRTAPVQGEPREEDFTDHKEYMKAIARWEARQELQAERDAERQARQNESVKEIFDAHNQRIVEARARIDDFDEVISGTTTPWRDNDPEDISASRAFQIAIFESDNGPDILYHLAQNPEEFARMGDLTPTKVQREVWRLSEKLGKAAPAEEEEEQVEEEKPEAKAKPVSKAPTPIKPVSSGTTKSSKRLDELSMAEYKKARAAGRIS